MVVNTLLEADQSPRHQFMGGGRADSRSSAQGERRAGQLLRTESHGLGPLGQLEGPWLDSHAGSPSEFPRGSLSHLVTFVPTLVTREDGRADGLLQTPTSRGHLRPASCPGSSRTGERSFVHKLPCESESALGLTQKEVPCSRAVRRPLCPCRSIWKTPRLSNVPRSHGQSLEGQGVDRCSRSPQVPPRRQALTPTAPQKGPRKQTSLSFHFTERKPLKTAFNQTVHRNYAQCFWGHPGAQAQAP